MKFVKTFYTVAVNLFLILSLVFSSSSLMLKAEALSPLSEFKDKRVTLEAERYEALFGGQFEEILKALKKGPNEFPQNQEELDTLLKPLLVKLNKRLEEQDVAYRYLEHPFWQPHKGNPRLLLFVASIYETAQADIVLAFTPTGYATRPHDISRSHYYPASATLELESFKTETAEKALKYKKKKPKSKKKKGQKKKKKPEEQTKKEVQPTTTPLEELQHWVSDFKERILSNKEALRTNIPDLYPVWSGPLIDFLDKVLQVEEFFFYEGLPTTERQELFSAFIHNKQLYIHKEFISNWEKGNPGAFFIAVLPILYYQSNTFFEPAPMWVYSETDPEIAAIEKLFHIQRDSILKEMERLRAIDAFKLIGYSDAAQLVTQSQRIFEIFDLKTDVQAMLEGCSFCIKNNLDLPPVDEFVNGLTEHLLTSRLFAPAKEQKRLIALFSEWIVSGFKELSQRHRSDFRSAWNNNTEEKLTLFKQNLLLNITLRLIRKNAFFNAYHLLLNREVSVISFYSQISWKNKKLFIKALNAMGAYSSAEALSEDILERKTTHITREYVDISYEYIKTRFFNYVLLKEKPIQSPQLSDSFEEFLTYFSTFPGAYLNTAPLQAMSFFSFLHASLLTTPDPDIHQIQRLIEEWNKDKTRTAVSNNVWTLRLFVYLAQYHYLKEKNKPESPNLSSRYITWLGKKLDESLKRAADFSKEETFEIALLNFQFQLLQGKLDLVFKLLNQHKLESRKRTLELKTELISPAPEGTDKTIILKEMVQTQKQLHLLHLIFALAYYTQSLSVEKDEKELALNRAFSQIWDFSEGEVDEGHSVVLALETVYPFLFERQFLEELLSKMLLDYTPEEELLRVSALNLYDMLFQLKSELAYSVITTAAATNQLKEKHLLALASRFWSNKRNSLIFFFLDLSALASENQMPELNKKCQDYITRLKKELSLEEKIQLVQWYLKKGSSGDAKTLLKEIRRKAKNLAPDSFIKQELKTLEESFLYWEQFQTIYEKALVLLNKKSFNKARALIPQTDSIPTQAFKIRFFKLKELIDKTEMFFDSYGLKYFNLILTNDSMRFHSEELTLLSSEIKEAILTAQQKAKKELALAAEATKKITELNALFPKTRYLSIERLTRYVKKLRDQATSIADAETFKRDAEEQSQALLSKIESRLEQVEHIEPIFYQQIQKKQFSKALESLTTILRQDFSVEGSNNKTSLFWTFTNALYNKENVSQVTPQIFEQARKLIDELSENVLRQEDFYAPFSDIEKIRGFLFQASTQIKRSAKLHFAQKRLALLKVEEAITGALWLKEIKKDFKKTDPGVRDQPTAILVHKIKPINDGEGSVKGFRIRTGDVVEGSPSFYLNDSYRIWIANQKGREVLDKTVTLTDIVEDSPVFDFSETSSSKERDDLITQLRNHEFWLQRIPSRQYLEQNSFLKQLIAQVEISLLQRMPLYETDPIKDRIEIGGMSYHINWLLGFDSFTFESQTMQPIPFYDRLLETDPHQYQATLAALHPRKVPILPLLGPGGTGKTRVLLEVLRHDSAKEKNILITAQTHPAVDLIASEIIQMNALREKQGLASIPFVRMGASDEKIGASLPDGEIEIEEGIKINVKSILLATWKDRIKILEKALKEGTGIIVLGTATGFNESKFRHLQSIQGRTFFRWDRIIIDEAGKMSKAELLLLLEKLKFNGQLILAGDAKQLPPHEVSKAEAKEIRTLSGQSHYEGKRLTDIFSLNNRLQHQVSFLELIEKEELFHIFRLKKSRRFVPLIAGLAKHVVYGEELLPKDQDQEREKTEQDALSVISYAGNGKTFEQLDEKTKSWFNMLEIRFALEEFYKKFQLKFDAGPKKGEYRYNIEDILFISPYRQQLAHYDSALRLSSIYFRLVQTKNYIPKQWDKIAKLLEKLIGYWPYCEPPQTSEEAIHKIQEFIRTSQKSNSLFSFFTSINKENIRYPELTLVETLPTTTSLSGEERNLKTKNKNGSSTIHKIQGSQRKVIIFSAVRSNHENNVGFFGGKEGPAFVTVAITRPEEKLVIIYDKNTLHNAAQRISNTPLRDFAIQVAEMFKRIEEYYLYWKKNQYGESWRDLFPDLHSFTSFEEAV